MPEDARALVLAPSVETLRVQLTAMLAGVEGLSGALDLLEARVGLDLRTREGLDAAGLDPDQSLSLFERDGSVGLAVGVTDANRFHARVARQVARLGGASVQTLQEDGGPVGVATGTGWSVAWGTGPDAVGLVIGASADAADTWRAIAAERRADDTLIARATEALAGRVGAFVTVQGPPEIPDALGLGPAKLVLLPVLGGLTEWEGAWVVEPERMALTLDGRWTTDGALAADWFQPAGEPVNLAAVIPKSQTLTARARLNLARVRGIPPFLRKRLIPDRVPGPLGGLLPPVMELSSLLNGDVAVSILGLDPSATVDHALKGSSLAEALQLVHGAVVFGVTDPAAARAAIATALAQLRGQGWYGAELDSDGWTGVALRREDSPAIWSVIQRDNIVAIMSGAGEVGRFVRVARGTATSLEASANGPVATATTSSPEVALGLSAGFRRITRELSDKGLPPFFLQMVNDLRSINASVRFRADGATAELEVSL